MSAAADMDADPLAVELRTKRICRMCLSTEEPLSDLYSHENRLKGRVPLPLQIMSSVSLEVSASGRVPVLAGFLCISVCPRHSNSNAHSIFEHCTFR